MINLEELQLYLSIGRTDRNYVDGVQLNDQFLIHMTKLKKFSFDIQTQLYNGRDIEVKVQSKEEIQKSFTGKHYQEVVSDFFIRFNDG